MTFFKGGIQIFILTVDRIEGTFAVCLDERGNSIDIPLEAIPGVKEGDVLEAVFSLRPDLKKKKENKINSLFERLKKKGESNEN